MINVAAGYRIGIDVGGTFTDLVAIDDRGRITTAKSASTPQDQSIGVLDGLEQLADALGIDRPALLGATERIVHGTTVATNALLERKGAKLGLLTTEGHRDVLEMREGLKDDRYALRQPAPDPLVPRHLRLPVRERIRADGERGDAARGPYPARGHWRPRGGAGRGGGGVLPARLALAGARAHHRRGPRPRPARSVRLALVRRLSPDQGVRAGLHDRRQRLRRSRAGALPGTPGRAAGRGRVRGTGADHAVSRRSRDGGRRGPPRRGGRSLGAGRRGGGGAPREPDPGARQPHCLRHGRDEHRHVAHRGGRGRGLHGPPGRGPPGRPAQPRHREHRRRRRLRRPRRRGRCAARRSGQRRRRSGAGLLRAGRDRTLP